MPGALPRPSIHASYHVEGRHLFTVVRIHRFLYDARDGGKAELPVEKMFDGDLVGRVQDDWKGAAGTEGAVREVQARKAVACRGVKIQVPGV
jgi:hypothetical protein